MKKNAARTHGALLEAIGRTISAITLEAAVGYFGQCGYPLDTQPP